MIDDLVSPVADSFETRMRAARTASISGCVALVDAMLNPAGLWGQGILDSIEEELVRRHPDATVERFTRPQIGATPPDVWAAAMADRYAALVIAAGD